MCGFFYDACQVSSSQKEPNPIWAAHRNCKDQSLFGARMCVAEGCHRTTFREKEQTEGVGVQSEDEVPQAIALYWRSLSLCSGALRLGLLRCAGHDGGHMRLEVLDPPGDLCRVVRSILRVGNVLHAALVYDEEPLGPRRIRVVEVIVDVIGHGGHFPVQVCPALLRALDAVVLRFVLLELHGVAKRPLVRRVCLADVHVKEVHLGVPLVVRTVPVRRENSKRGSAVRAGDDHKRSPRLRVVRQLLLLTSHRDQAAVRVRVAHLQRARARHVVLDVQGHSAHFLVVAVVPALRLPQAQALVRRRQVVFLQQLHLQVARDVAVEGHVVLRVRTLRLLARPQLVLARVHLHHHVAGQLVVADDGTRQHHPHNVALLHRRSLHRRFAADSQLPHLGADDALELNEPACNRLRHNRLGRRTVLNLNRDILLLV
eukprot:Rhum_TRINITY_DN18788_c0_g1::Rhum_TRINITY_DN18788_c0_g1_i1::g.168420::m.168420